MALNTTSIIVDDDVELAYTSVGEGPTILFHQGFSLTQMVWESIVDRLKADHRCVTFDPRGHGDSDAPISGYTIDRLATDVAELSAALDTKNITLVGHSLGGAVAFSAVADQKPGGSFTRLILLGAAVPGFVRRAGQPHGVPPEMFAGLLRSIEEDFPATILATAEIFFHQTDPRAARRVFDAALSMRGDVAADLFAQLGDIDLADRLTDLKVPVLGLWGEHDTLSNPAWANWFRELGLGNWEIDTLAESGHGPMLDEPDELAARIAAFIRRSPHSA